jgi:hypothetical protein
MPDTFPRRAELYSEGSMALQSWEEQARNRGEKPGLGSWLLALAAIAYWLFQLKGWFF